MTELKPCPFCGGGASDHRTILGAKCCAQCGAIEGGWRGTIARPVGWNTRPIEDALRAEVARLQAENQKMHHDWMAEHAAFEDFKARYEADLTDEQAQAVWDALPTDYFGEDGKTLARQCDATIRKVRGEP